MTDRPSAKRIFAIVSKITAASPSTEKIKKKTGDTNLKRASRSIAKCLDRAFKEAGRDINRDEDWLIVSMWLAVSLFSGKKRGAPRRWSRRKLLRLVADVERIKLNGGAKGGTKTDMECCRDLVKLPRYSKMKGKNHTQIKASGLRRRLGSARAMRALEAVDAARSDTPTTQSDNQ
jgi:hypothetical protein